MTKTNWFEIITELNKKGVSCRKIASIMSVSHSTVHNWKNGVCSPNYDLGVKLVAMYESVKL